VYCFRYLILTRRRGWGRSVTKPAERGDTGPTSQVLDDITSFIKTLIPSPVPLFMMGHSMGGGETLCYAAQGPEEVRKHIRGFLLESLESSWRSVS
jgi:acylglycerol lipase